MYSLVQRSVPDSELTVLREGSRWKISKVLEKPSFIKAPVFLHRTSAFIFTWNWTLFKSNWHSSGHVAKTGSTGWWERLIQSDRIEGHATREGIYSRCPDRLACVAVMLFGLVTIGSCAPTYQCCPARCSNFLFNKNLVGPFWKLFGSSAPRCVIFL